MRQRRNNIGIANDIDVFYVPTNIEIRCAALPHSGGSQSRHGSEGEKTKRALRGAIAKYRSSTGRICFQESRRFKQAAATFDESGVI